jgi:hypothetical protein
MFVENLKYYRREILHLCRKGRGDYANSDVPVHRLKYNASVSGQN